MTAPIEPLTCWAVTDGRVGIENQALGLAQAVAHLLPLRITVKRIEVREPWRSLPRALWGDPFEKLSTEGALLRPPYPDLWIGCGRVSAPFTMAVKEIHPATMTVQIQDPRAPLSRFDLVIPPEHDRLTGENVLPIIGAPSRVTRELIDHDAEHFYPRVAALPRPLAVLLVGGPNRAFDMSPPVVMRLARIARKVVRAGGGVMATPSRRTPEGVMATLGKALERFPHFIWDGSPVNGLANPYFGMLGLADLILVTEDSVNMAAEAAITGKPVHILPLGRKFAASAAKFQSFHANLAARGAARRYEGRFDFWSYEPLDETGRAAEAVARRLATRARAKLHPANRQPDGVARRPE